MARPFFTDGSGMGYSKWRSKTTVCSPQRFVFHSLQWHRSIVPRVLPTVVGDGRARPALELNDQDLQAHDHYSNYRDLSNLVKYKSTKRP